MLKIGFVAIFLICLKGYSNDTIRIFNTKDPGKAFTQVSMCEQNIDKSSDFNQIIKSPDLFRNIPSHDINLGIAEKNYWFSFCLYNATDTVTNMIFSLKNPLLNYVDYYEVDEKGKVNSVHTGECLAFNTRSIWNRYFLFKIQLNPHETKKYYIKVANNGDSVFFPMTLEDEEEAFEKVGKDYLFNSFYYGIFLFLIIFNLLLLFILKNKIFIFYILYTVCSLFFYLNNDGLSFQLLWPNSPWWGVHSYNFFLALGMFIFLIFTKSFFETRESFPKFNKVINVIGIIYLIPIILFFIPYPWYLYLSMVSAYLTPLIFINVMVVASLSIRRKVILSQYILAAYSIWLLVSTIYIFRDIGLLPDIFLTENSMKIGFFLEGFILMAALIIRSKEEWKAKNTELQVKNSTIQVQNDKLEVINEELLYLSTVASESENGIAIISNHGLIEWTNNRFLSTHHISSGKGNYPIENVFENIDIHQKLMQCEAQKTALSFEYNIPVNTNSSSPTWILVTLSPRLNDDQQVHIIAIESDIAKIKQYESELKVAIAKAEESDRLKSAFLANMSHEIRTPMNAILGFSGLLTIPTYSDDKKKFFVNIIEARTMDLLRIVNDLMDISKLDAGQMKIYSKDDDLGSIFNLLHEYYVKSTQESIEGVKDIEIINNYCLNKEEGFIHSDFVRINQILTNLIDNAIKFTQKGFIEFGCSIRNDELLFYVKDTGIGIPKDKLHLIFGRFRQVDEKSTRTHGGSGLGLAISKGLLDIMNGEIWVESQVNKGSTFYFTLPYKPVTKNVVIKEEITYSKILKRKHILIVEDDTYNTNYLAEILANIDANCVYTPSGKDVMSLLTQNPLTEIVLLDISLPDIDGKDLAKIIKEKYPQMVIIAQTAYAGSKDKEQCIEAGCDFFISKPYTKDALINMIHLV